MTQSRSHHPSIQYLVLYNTRRNPEDELEVPGSLSDKTHDTLARITLVENVL